MESDLKRGEATHLRRRIERSALGTDTKWPREVMQESEKLKNVGLRATTQRLAVLRVFESNERKYWNAEDVYRQATADREHIGRATVYRTLAQLADVGILVRSVLDADSGVAFYKLHGARHHDLLVCLGCTQVHEFVDDALEARTRRLAESHDFVLRRYQLMIYGYCAGCQATSEASVAAAPRG